MRMKHSIYRFNRIYLIMLHIWNSIYAIIIYFVIVLLFTFNNSSAQNVSFYTIDEKDKLPSNEVYQIAQSKEGYIYIGSSSGLHKYDGYSFKAIKSLLQNAASISNLQFDEDGTLWCQNFAGQLYFIRNDSLILFKTYASSKNSYPLFTIQGKTVWTYVNTQLVQYDKYGKMLNVINAKESKESNSSSLYISSKNELEVLIISKGLWRLDTKTNKLVHVSENEDFGNRCFQFSHKGANYILAEKNPERNYNLYKIENDISQRIMTIPPNSLAKIIYLIRIIDHVLYVCTSNGVFLFDENNLAQPIGHLFENKNISFLMQDSEKNIWFASLGSGIHVIPQSKVLQINEDSYPFSNQNFTAIDVDSKGIFYGNINGDFFQTKNNQTTKFKSRFNDLYRNTSKVKISNDNIFVSHGGISVFDKNGNETYYSSNYVRDIDYANGKIYVLSNMGYYWIDFVTGQRSNLIKASGRHIAVNLNGTQVVLATSEGLMEPEKDSLNLFLVDGKSIYASNILFNNDTCWVGTLSDGIYGIHNHKIVYHFNSDNGLKGNRIIALHAYNNNVFVATDESFSIISLPDNKIVNYGQSLPFNLSGINAIATWNDSIYLATQSGIYYFNSNTIKEQPENLKIFLTQIKINNKSKVLSNRFELSYNENNIQCCFKSISFSSKSNINYKYRLIGESSEWKIINGFNDHIEYEALAPGNYSLEIKSVNELEQESSNTLKIDFIIHKPFWLQTWFVLLSILLFSSLLVVFVSRMIRSIRKKEKEKQQLIEFQLTALKSQMNPHFIFNGLNSIQDLIMQQDVKKSNLYLSKFSSLIRKILEYSEKELVSVAEEIALTLLYLDIEQLRFGDDFHYEINIDELINQDEVKIPTMIIQPFVENAIKYGLFHKKGFKSLKINFELEKQYLLCTIIDNGIGRAKANEINVRNRTSHKSFATDAIFKRLNLLNTKGENSFEIIDLFEHEKSIGTKVIIKFSVDS